MGTDIHLCVRHRNEDTNEWENLALYKKTRDGEFEKVYIGEGRNYILFGKLAGVRSCEDGFAFLRGLPKDIDEETRRDYEEGCHSATYYDWCELQALSRTPEAFYTEEVYDYDKDEYVDGEKWNVIEPWLTEVGVILDAYGIYYPKPNEVQIVMYFDS